MADQNGLPDEDDVVEATPTEGEDGEFEIEVVDDTPVADRGRKPLEKPVEDPSDEELEVYSEGVKKRMGELTHARHDERRAKEAALREKQELERFARALAAENQQLKEQYTAGAHQFAATATNAADLRLANARAQLKAAHDAFDTDAIVAAQEELTDAKNEWVRAKSFKPPTLQPAQPVVQQQQQREPDPAPVDEATLRWQAKNQWWGTPEHQSMTLFSLGVHNELANSGVVAGSDEYFEKIDSRLRETFPAFFGVAQQKSKRTSSVVAPGARVSGARKIQLTPTALALAKRLGLTPQQYAASVAKQGQIDG